VQHFCSLYNKQRYFSCLPADRPQSSGHRGEKWAGHSHSLRAQLGCPLPHLYCPIPAEGTLLSSIGMSRCVATLILGCRLPHQTPVCTAPFKLLRNRSLERLLFQKAVPILCPILRCSGPAEVLMLNSQSLLSGTTLNIS